MCTRAPQSNGDIYWVEPGFTEKDKDHVWKEKEDKAKGKKYYSNLASSEKVWKLPAGASSSSTSGGKDKDKDKKEKKEKKEKKDKKDKKSSSKKGSDDDERDDDDDKNNNRKPSVAPSDTDSIAAGGDYGYDASASADSILKKQQQQQQSGALPENNFWTQDPRKKQDLDGVILPGENGSLSPENRRLLDADHKFDVPDPSEERYRPRQNDQAMDDLRRLAEKPHKDEFVPGKPDGINRHSTSPFGVDDPDFLPSEQNEDGSYRRSPAGRYNTASEGMSPTEDLVHSTDVDRNNKNKRRGPSPQQYNGDGDDDNHDNNNGNYSPAPRYGGGLRNYEPSASETARPSFASPSATIYNSQQPPPLSSINGNTNNNSESSSKKPSSKIMDIDSFLQHQGIAENRNDNGNNSRVVTGFGRPGPPLGEKALLDDHFEDDFSSFLSAEKKSREASLAANSPNRVRHPADDHRMELIDAMFKPPRPISRNDMASLQRSDFMSVPRIHGDAIQSLTDAKFMESLYQDLEEHLSENEIRYMRHLRRSSEENAARAAELREQIKFADQELGIASTTQWNEVSLRGEGYIDAKVMESILGNGAVVQGSRDFADRLDRLQHQIRTSHRESIKTAETIWEYFLACLDAGEVDVAWIESVKDM